jgi:membrane protease YdiL (CAAX protease family)
MHALGTQPFPHAHPEPVGEHPELPPGIVPSRQRRPRWRPWSAVLALIAALVAALFGAAVIGIAAAPFGASLSDPPGSVTILATIWQDLCFIGAALFFARAAERPWPWQFGLRRVPVWPAVGWAIVAWLGFYAFTAAFVGILGLHPKEDDLPEQLGINNSTIALIVVALLVAVIAPVAEEFFFRGFFFGALRNWKGTWPAALITGLVFGGIHAGSSDPAYLVPLAAFGLALCLLYVKTGSLYPCIGLHCANNSVAFGVTQNWTWQIPLLFTVSIGLLTLLAREVERRWDRPLGPAGPAPAVG